MCTSIGIPCVRREEPRLGERRFGLLLGVDHLRVDRHVERDPDHVQDVDLAALLLGEPERGAEHLLADEADLHRDEDALVRALEVGDEVADRRRDAAEDPLPRGEPGADEDDARRTRARSARRCAPRRA